MGGNKMGWVIRLKATLEVAVHGVSWYFLLQLFLPFIHFFNLTIYTPKYLNVDKCEIECFVIFDGGEGGVSLYTKNKNINTIVNMAPG